MRRTLVLSLNIATSAFCRLDPSPRRYPALSGVREDLTYYTYIYYTMIYTEFRKKIDEGGRDGSGTTRRTSHASRRWIVAPSRVDQGPLGGRDAPSGVRGEGSRAIRGSPGAAKRR